jgi:hypothetical protein
MTPNLEHLSTSLPEQKNYEVAYGLAFQLAADKLCNYEDLVEYCQRSESIYQISGTSQSVRLKYLGNTFQVSLPDITISNLDSDEEVELRDRILILHYLTQARGTPLSNKLIAYQELREGAAYYPTFVKRAVKPLIDYFGPAPEKLVEVSCGLGGVKAPYGDVAVTIPAFNRVPLTLVLWRGDDEFPPNANILFDSTILDYLSAEDINVLCQTLVWRLVKML